SLPTFEADQRFGPRTPLVLARAAQLWSTRDLAGWVKAIASFGAGASLTWPFTLASAAARPVGRSEAVRQLEREAMPFVDHLIAGRAAEWDSAIEALARAFSFDA